MQGQINQKIAGASIVGFALVAGAYTISNFGAPDHIAQTATVQNSVSTQRVAIAVADNDNNGIEDWRDEFVTAQPVILNRSTSTYTLPDTLTGKMSINFLENIISSKTNGPFGNTQEEIVQQTVDYLSSKTTAKLYNISEIDVIEVWNDQDVVNYGNTLGATIRRYNNPNLAGELEILFAIMDDPNSDRISELEDLAEVYRNYRDDTLNTPVPKILIKEHLDLINTFNAIYEDIAAMALAFSDPAVSLLRLKRYQDDATGLAYAMQNMFFALEPYSDQFGPDDPATLFVIFSPDYQI